MSYEQYDRAAETAYNETGALGVALIVVGGNHGDGLSIYGPDAFGPMLPEILRAAADSFERHLAGGRPQ